MLASPRPRSLAQVTPRLQKGPNGQPLVRQVRAHGVVSWAGRQPPLGAVPLALASLQNGLLAGWLYERPGLLYPLPRVAGEEPTYEAVGGGTRFWLMQQGDDENATGWAQVLDPETPQHVRVRVFLARCSGWLRRIEGRQGRCLADSPAPQTVQVLAAGLHNRLDEHRRPQTLADTFQELSRHTGMPPGHFFTLSQDDIAVALGCTRSQFNVYLAVLRALRPTAFTALLRFWAEVPMEKLRLARPSIGQLRATDFSKLSAESQIELITKHAQGASTIPDFEKAVALLLPDDVTAERAAVAEAAKRAAAAAKQAAPAKPAARAKASAAKPSAAAAAAPPSKPTARPPRPQRDATRPLQPADALESELAELREALRASREEAEALRMRLVAVDQGEGAAAALAAHHHADAAPAAPPAAAESEELARLKADNTRLRKARKKAEVLRVREVEEMAGLRERLAQLEAERRPSAPKRPLGVSAQLPQAKAVKSAAASGADALEGATEQHEALSEQLEKLYKQLRYAADPDEDSWLYDDYEAVWRQAEAVFDKLEALVHVHESLAAPEELPAKMQRSWEGRVIRGVS